MNDRAALLFANDRFYRAFADADMQAMAALWAQDGPITCLHPGWAPLSTRDEVLASFSAIFSGPAPPAIRTAPVDVALHGTAGGSSVGIVICYEVIGSDYLVATNIFRRGSDASQDAQWQLIHHQAGPVNEAPPQEDETPGAVN